MFGHESLASLSNKNVTMPANRDCFNRGNKNKLRKIVSRFHQVPREGGNTVHYKLKLFTNRDALRPLGMALSARLKYLYFRVERVGQGLAFNVN